MPAAPPTAPPAVRAALGLMSLASGCMDILCYQRLGQVFPSAMTGNTALLGLSLGQGDLVAAPRNLAALLGFVLGLTLATGLLRTRLGLADRFRATFRLLLLEEALLIGFAVIWQIGAGPSSGGLRFGLIGLAAIAMGVQSAAAYHVSVPGLSTTYFTGTLNRIVARIFADCEPPTEQRPVGGMQLLVSAFAAYLAGAVLAGFLLFGPRPMLASLPANTLPTLPALLIALVVLIGIASHLPRRAR